MTQWSTTVFAVSAVFVTSTTPAAMLAGALACATLLLATLRYGLWYRLSTLVVGFVVAAVLWLTAVVFAQDACELPLHAVVQVGVAVVLAVADVCTNGTVTATSLAVLCVSATNLLPLTDNTCLYAAGATTTLLATGAGFKVFIDVAS
ncbi:hypothetical protein [Nereida ignava]|uniref:hypothetical protein n=1 Tax=Nereida ignava TaxID=282199 RepID=UPI0030F526ED